MPENSLPLVIEVVKVQGHCPVHRVGDSFCIRKGNQLLADQPVCLHAIRSISPYSVPLSRGLQAHELGMSGYQGSTFFQCADANCFTRGCIVTFRITNDESRITHQKPFDGRIPIRW